MKCKLCGIVSKKPNKSKLGSVNKLKKVLKKYNLKKQELSGILGVSTVTVYSWFNKNINPDGKVKSIYFDILEKKKLI